VRSTTTLPTSLHLTPELHSYLIAQTSMPADELLDELVEATNQLLPEHAHMVVAPEEGALLTFLVRLLQPLNVLEVGTFTGYSSLCLARGLPPGGRLTTFDVSTEFTGLARQFWTRAGVGDKIELRIGPAVDTLRALPLKPYLDLAFIDADKPGYISYWEEIVPRMRPGGLVIADNTLFSGQVLDLDPGPKPAAIRAFNEHIRADDRVELVMLAVADGLTLARRVEPGA
jgi:caffeoyl-CoA O-methyltransferase